MSIASRNTLKTGFVAGTAATATKFADLIDSAFNRNDDSLELGPTGMTGATGSVSGLRTRSISTMSTGFGSFCSSFGIGGPSLLNGNSSISVSGSFVTFNKNCTNLTESTVTVYAP